MDELSLEGYCALDLTDDEGFLCDRILGNLGTDVSTKILGMSDGEFLQLLQEGVFD